MSSVSVWVNVDISRSCYVRFACERETMRGMAKEAEKIGRANPAWPAHTPGNGHPVTEISSKLTGANSPFGNELVLPMPAEQTGYVHTATRINK